ncbi:MAG: carboxypeptidase-like regulatory domain-containing protein [Deltaproteobacteria bacterium]|nr:carboxypeptidase-like regulatory domain-containing protein [Deltaproteobacteria bacterium]
MRVVVVSLLALLASSCFELPRSLGLGEGNIQFRVVDSAGGPVGGAVVSVDGVPRISTSNDDGLVSVSSLLPGDQVLRVSVDDDADGAPDRAAVVSGGVLRVEFDTGPFTAPVSKLTTDVLDDVAVAAVGALEGTVAGCGADLCRVVVFREVKLGALAPRDVAGVVEGSAGVGGDGSWSIPDLAPGPVKVVAFAWTRPLSTEPNQQLIAASRDITSFAVVDGVVLSGDVAVVDAVLAAAPASVATDLELGGEPVELERAQGQAFFSVPQLTVDVDSELTGVIVGALSPVDVPLGVFDISVQLDNVDGDPGLVGFLARVIAVPGVPRLGPLAVGVVVDCRQVGDKDDCDGDGLNIDDDGDDDGDGQLDAEESAACRGPGLGTDLDFDCLCEPADPFPGCQSNDPIACELVAAPVCVES